MLPYIMVLRTIICSALYWCCAPILAYSCRACGPTLSLLLQVNKGPEGPLSWRTAFIISVIITHTTQCAAPAVGPCGPLPWANIYIQFHTQYALHWGLAWGARPSKLVQQITWNHMKYALKQLIITQIKLNQANITQIKLEITSDGADLP